MHTLRLPSPVPERAFTLVEMLVCVAIIGVLAVVATMGFSQASSRAKQAQGLSNMRQVHTAINLYVADHGHYPNHVQQMGWWNLVADYADGNQEIFQSPAVDQEHFLAMGTNRQIMPYVLKVDYDNGINPPGSRPANIKRPSEIILLADSAMRPNATISHAFWMLYLHEDNPSRSGEPFRETDYHLGAGSSESPTFLPRYGMIGDDKETGIGNVIYVDGHAETKRWLEITRGEYFINY